MKFSVLPVCILVFTITACNRKEGNSTYIANDSASIYLADAKDFLPGWSKENIIIYHVSTEPSDLHPTNGNTSPRNEINLYTQEFLINTDYKNAGVCSPGMIKSMPVVSANGLEYRYELRTEPRWDDGSPLTLDDVFFTFKAIKCPLTNNPHAKPYWENVKEIRTDPSNDHVFTIVMSRPYIQNIPFLTDYPLMQRTWFDPKNILSHYSIEQFDSRDFKADANKDLAEWSNEFNNEKYGHDPKFLTGLGMYKVESWEQGQSITLVKKKNHWTIYSTDYHEIAFPEKIIFKLNKDDNSTMLEFKSQAMDASTLLSAKTLMTLKENAEFNKNYNSLFTLSYNYSYLAMNEKPDGVNHKKYFTDQKVRKAMAYATPVDKIIKFIYKDYSSQSKRAVCNVSPVKKEFDHTLQPVPLDIEKAKQLLDEAGWKDTDGDGIRDKIVDGEKVKFNFTLQFMNIGDWKDMATMVAEEMNKAGIQVSLLPLDLKIFIEKARKHDFDMMMGSWGGSSQSEDFTQLWHTNSWTSGGSNYSGFGNTQSDVLIDSIKTTLNDSIRMNMSKRLQRIIYDDQPYVFLYSSLRRNVIHKRFGNITVYADRPGILLNTFKLLQEKPGIAMSVAVTPN